MINTVKTSAGVSDKSPDRRSSKRDQDAAGQAAPDQAQEQAKALAPGSDLRLVIERDEKSGDYVYRLIDRATGQVVREQRRDQVANLAQAPDYRAGAVVSTKA